MEKGVCVRAGGEEGKSGVRREVVYESRERVREAWDPQSCCGEAE